jgi:hypothetical protein
MVTVNDVLEVHVTPDIQCLDRVHLNAYDPKLQASAQVVAFLSGIWLTRLLRRALSSGSAVGGLAWRSAPAPARLLDGWRTR